MRHQIIEIISRNLTIRTEYFTLEQDIQIYLAKYFSAVDAFDGVLVF